MMYHKKYFLSYSLLLFFMSFILFACNKDIEEEKKIMSLDNLDVSNVQNKSMPTTHLDKIYIVPNSLDYIKDLRPWSLMELEETNKILADFQDETELNIREELLKYLERKRQFEKSSVFSEIP